MRIARKLLLAALLAVAAMGTAASSSSAAVLLTHEPFGQASVACPALTGAGLHEVGGGCHLQMTSSVGGPNHPNHEAELRGHLFGDPFHVADCLHEFEIRMNSAGVGFVQHFLIFDTPTEGQLGCGEDLVRPCTEAEAGTGTPASNGPWSVTTAEGNQDQFIATIQECWVSGDLGKCQGPVKFEITPKTPVAPHTEDYEAEVVDTHAGVPNGIPCPDHGFSAEFEGHYDLNPENPSTEEIHIDHA